MNLDQLIRELGLDTQPLDVDVQSIGHIAGELSILPMHRLWNRTGSPWQQVRLEPTTRALQAGVHLYVHDGTEPQRAAMISDTRALKIQARNMDHGLIHTAASMLDDDHLNNLYLPGRAGGQIAVGGTASAERLDLTSTSHATKGGVRITASDWIEIPEIVAPATPVSGFGRLYAKTDNLLYWLNDLGTEYVLTAAGTVTAVTATLPLVSSGGATPNLLLDASAADKYLYSTAADVWTEGSVTAAGRAILDDADAAAQRTTLGLGTIATQAASAVAITGGTITGITDLAVADGGTGASTAATARTNLGLVIGTDVQAYDAELAALAGLISAADSLPYFTGAGTAALATLTAAARSILDDATVGAILTTIGGQPLDTDLTAIAALVSAADKTPYATGAGTWALADLTAAGRAILDDATAAAQRATLDVPSNAEAILDTLGDAKGDIIVFTAADTPTRLAVGTEGQVPTARAAAATGIAWETPAAGSANVYGVANCRLEYQSTTEVRLNALHDGKIDVNGTFETVDGSLAADQLTTLENLISSTGTDSGAAMGASTLSYVYRSNASASYAASSTRASATAPTAYRGAKYLATSGNGAAWRFIGWVRTNGSTQFADTDTSKLVTSYVNARPRRLFSCPGYSDNDALSSYTTTSTTWTAANGGTGSKLDFISDGIHPVKYAGRCSALGASATTGLLGVGEDSTTAAAIGAFTGATTVAGQVFGHASVGRALVMSEGYRFLELLIVNTAATTLTIYSDDARRGAAADPPLTYIEATVWG